MLVSGTQAVIRFPPAVMGELAWTLSMVVNVLAFSIPFRIRRGTSIEPCMTQLLTSLVLTLTTVSVQQGGAAAPSTLWLAIFPYLAFSIAGRRSALLVGGMSFLSGTALLVGSTQGWFPEPRITDDPAIVLSAITAMFAVVLLITAHAKSRIRNAVVADLHRANVGLEHEISGHLQTRERLKAAYRELVDAARVAGAAEVATGILHNLGNALNAVNVCAGLADNEAANLQIQRLRKIESLVRQTGNEPGVRYVAAVERDLEKGRSRLREQVGELRDAVEHAVAIVATQQRHAVRTCVAERVSIEEFLSDAVTLSRSSASSHVHMQVACSDLPDVFVDRHRLMQIVTNLLTNAQDAVEGVQRPHIRIGATLQANSLTIDVADNGVGITATALDDVFAHGFTTKPNGHGFGLHASALAATELGGSLQVTSAGPGQGAHFVLQVPIARSEVSIPIATA